MKTKLTKEKKTLLKITNAIDRQNREHFIKFFEWISVISICLFVCLIKACYGIGYMFVLMIRIIIVKQWNEFKFSLFAAEDWKQNDQRKMMKKMKKKHHKIRRYVFIHFVPYLIKIHFIPFSEWAFTLTYRPFFVTIISLVKFWKRIHKSVGG